MEAADVAYWSDKGNLPAFYGPSNPMPVALKNAAKAFDAGYHRGLDERLEEDRRRERIHRGTT